MPVVVKNQDGVPHFWPTCQKWGFAFCKTSVLFAPNTCPPGHSALPGHTTFDLTVGKMFGENFSASVSALNVANRRVELDNSVTFGGFHWNNPREVFVELRYRFHY